MIWQTNDTVSRAINRYLHAQSRRENFIGTIDKGKKALHALLIVRQLDENEKFVLRWNWHNHFGVKPLSVSALFPGFPLR